MKMKRLGILGGPAVVATCIFIAGMGAPAFSAEESAIPYSTPSGITLVDVVKIIGNASTQFMWRRLGDANGKPLYTYAKDAQAGRPVCVSECAKEFIPFSAPAGAKAFSDWTIVKREDGVRQWAYQGLPLYSYSGKDPDGEPSTSGLSTTGAEDPAAMDPGSKIFSPKEEWQRAAFAPAKTFPTPADLELQSLPTANGYGIVDVNTKKVAYILKHSPKNVHAWTPIYAPGLAVPMGTFSIVTRKDGTKQWTYRGQGLYSFNGDYSTSDTNGVLAEKEAQVALIYRHFMPESVEIKVFPGRGPLMMTKAGLSVYTQSRQQLQYGGRETRDGYRYPYSAAKAVGTRGCVNDCTTTWQPVVAPANARAAGFWEVETRTDGKKQWAYKGSPLYTYVRDEKAGDIAGNNRHEIIFGDPTGKRDLSITGGDIVGSKYAAGSGLYWHLAGLFY